MLVFISIVFQINAWLFKNIHIKVNFNLLKYNIVKKKCLIIQTGKQTSQANIFVSYQFIQLTKTKILQKYLKFINDFYKLFKFVIFCLFGIFYIIFVYLSH